MGREMTRFRKGSVFAMFAAVGVMASSGLRCEVRSAPPPIEAYGRLPVLTDASLSPSGDRLALVRHQGEDNRVVIQDISGNLLLYVDAHKEKIRNVDWVSDRFLLLHSTVTAENPFDLGRQEYNIFRSVDIDKRKTLNCSQTITASSRLFPILRVCVF